MTILLDSADAMRDLARGSWIETHRTLCVKTLLSYRARIFGSFSSDSARDLYEDPPELPRKNQAGVPCKLHYFQEQLARFTLVPRFAPARNDQTGVRSLFIRSLPRAGRTQQGFPREREGPNERALPFRLHYFQGKLARFTSGLQSVAL